MPFVALFGSCPTPTTSRPCVHLWAIKTISLSDPSTPSEGLWGVAKGEREGVVVCRRPRCCVMFLYLLLHCHRRNGTSSCGAGVVAVIPRYSYEYCITRHSGLLATAAGCTDRYKSGSLGNSGTCVLHISCSQIDNLSLHVSDSINRTIEINYLWASCRNAISHFGCHMESRSHIVRNDVINPATSAQEVTHQPHYQDTRTVHGGHPILHFTGRISVGVWPTTGIII